MRKKAIIAAVLAAVMLSGCSESEKNESTPTFGTQQSSSSEAPKSSVISERFSPSSADGATSGSENDLPDNENSLISTDDVPNDEIAAPIISSSSDIGDGKIPYELRSSTGVVWDYPINSDLSYNFASGKIIKGLEQKYGKTGADLGYTGEWCAEVISDLLIENGYRISPKYNPCDLAIQLLNKNYAHFYCIREENFDSLVQYGLRKKGQNRVVMTTSEEFTPKRGDLVCFLWNEENDIYNWSHIGIVAEDYDGTVLRTIEGNVGVSEFPDDPRIRTVDGREREYNETVIGFIRLDK
ncbi:MAG TPA: hypothetical protein DEQ68_07740 [Ruminococcaceae bacterium]|nr:hypothetical protein [Oscillospiraceae bacterium]